MLLSFLTVLKYFSILFLYSTWSHGGNSKQTSFIFFFAFTMMFFSHKLNKYVIWTLKICYFVQSLMQALSHNHNKRKPQGRQWTQNAWKPNFISMIGVKVKCIALAQTNFKNSAFSSLQSTSIFMLPHGCWIFKTIF